MVSTSADTPTDTPEVGLTIDAGGVLTNYHDFGEGAPVVLLHGSGPGVSAWANWRLNIPALAERFRVLAPDLLGFGFTERPAHCRYDLPTWRTHLVAFLDALDLERVSLIGNSFGGALAIDLATRLPDRVNRLVLMGSGGLSFPLTEGLNEVWGYEPSIENMRRILEIMAYDSTLVSDELAELRYRASIVPGTQEAFSSMFPAPRQDGIEAISTPEQSIRGILHEVLIVHGRGDRVLPVNVAYRLLDLIENSQLHVFGRSGHWTQIEQCDRFNRLAIEFLAEA